MQKYTLIEVLAVIITTIILGVMIVMAILGALRLSNWVNKVDELPKFKVEQPKPIDNTKEIKELKKNILDIIKALEVHKKHIQTLESENEDMKQFIMNLFQSFGLNNTNNDVIYNKLPPKMELD